MKEIEFEIDREAVRQYFQTVHVIACFGILAFCFVPYLLIGTLDVFAHAFLRIGVFSKFFGLMFFLTIVAIAYSFVFAPWLCRWQADNFRYRLDGDTVRIDGGVFFLFRKSIPLERITDVALVQGPLMRLLGCMWTMKIQTAGSPMTEAVLYGVREPEKIRELILVQRRNVYAEKSGDASVNVVFK